MRVGIEASKNMSCVGDFEANESLKAIQKRESESKYCLSVMKTELKLVKWRASLFAFGSLGTFAVKVQNESSIGNGFHLALRLARNDGILRLKWVHPFRQPWSMDQSVLHHLHHDFSGSHFRRHSAYLNIVLAPCAWGPSYWRNPFHSRYPAYLRVWARGWGFHHTELRPLLQTHRYIFISHKEFYKLYYSATVPSSSTPTRRMR